MNRYPLWKYVLVAVALLFGLIYTLPNFFGESPAVQVSSAKATLKIDISTRERVASTCSSADIEQRHLSRQQRRQGSPVEQRYPAAGKGCPGEAVQPGQ
jgi:preprotein translocase subunit SecD